MLQDNDAGPRVYARYTVRYEHPVNNPAKPPLKVLEVTANLLKGRGVS
jgi:hypothetical protein